MAADLAFELRFLLAVVEVEIFVRSIAGRTDNQFWNHEGFTPTLDRGQRFAIFGLIGGQKLFVVFLRMSFFLRPGGSVRGGLGSTKKSR